MQVEVDGLALRELMEHALYWCRTNEGLGRKFLSAYYERYVCEKHGYERGRLLSFADFNALGVLAQRSLSAKWRGIADAIEIEMWNENFNYAASTVSLNGTRWAILSGMSFKATNMAHNLRDFTSRSESEHVILANIIMKRRKPEERVVTTEEIIGELQYWYESATYFVERPLKKRLAQRAKDSQWQHEEIRGLLTSEHVLAFLCGTRADSVSLVKSLKSDLLAMIISLLFGHK